MTPLVILLLCLGQAGAQFPEISAESDSDLEEALLSLILKLRQDEFFDNLLIYGRDCIFHQLTKSLGVSTVLVTLGSTNFDWAFSSLTLILCCDDEAEDGENQRTFMKTQRNRRLIYIEENMEPEKVCNGYFEDEAYNVAIVKEDFGRSNIIYTCRLFQKPNFEQVSLREAKPIYIENFRNMQGSHIRAMRELMPPRTMAYEDKKTGKKKLIGYVANLFTNFAQRLNATLELYIIQENSNGREILLNVRAGILDMGMMLETYVHPKSLDTASYPYIHAPYCVMLQVPAKLPYNLVYGKILDPPVLGILFVLFCILSVLLIYSRKKSWQDLSLANVLLNDVSLRGLLGQSFPFPSNASKHLRLIFIILCFASVMLTTMYAAYLQSYFTNPPSEPTIRSFQDFTKFNKKLAISRFELDELRMTNNSRFKDINEKDLVVIEDSNEFIRIRDSLNQSYSYLVTGDHWSTCEEQQKMFKEPVFYLSNDLCLSHLIPIAIPVRRFLPYRHLFDEHIMSQNEFGLVGYWRAHSFLDMVRLGIRPLVSEDLRQTKTNDKSLILKDVSWVLELYLAAMVFSICCFILEVLSARERFSR